MKSWLNFTGEIYLKNFSCTHCSSCFADGFCKTELHGLLNFTSFLFMFPEICFEFPLFFIFFSKNDVLKHEAFSLSFHFVCILKRKCKATFSLSFHFVCSLKRKCKGCLFTLNQNCKASFALSFHFVCSFHFLFTFFSLLMQSAKMLFSLLSNCNQSEKKVKRQPLHFLVKLQTK